MKKYIVAVIETNFGGIEVEADTKEEAEEKAWELFNQMEQQGGMDWDSKYPEFEAEEIEEE